MFRTARFLPALKLTLVALVFLRALVPAGFMPAAAQGSHGHDRVALVICTGMGPQTVYLPAGDTPVKETPAKDHPASATADIPCAFAAVFATGIAPDTSLLPVPVIAAAAPLRALFIAPPVSCCAAYHAQAPPV